MDSKLLSPAAGDSATETVQPAQQSCPQAEALADVRKAIAADCCIAPDEYLEEIRVAASGE
jgi:hypothetical protein